jgi:hypothetical protein
MKAIRYLRLADNAAARVVHEIYAAIHVPLAGTPASDRLLRPAIAIKMY